MNNRLYSNPKNPMKDPMPQVLLNDVYFNSAGQLVYTWSYAQDPYYYTTDRACPYMDIHGEMGLSIQ